MGSFTLLSPFFALASIVSGLPTDNHIPPSLAGPVTLPLVFNDGASTSGHYSGRSANLTNRATSAYLSNVQNAAYFIKLAIGDEEFDMLFDTGGRSSFVYGKDCTGQLKDSGRKLYDGPSDGAKDTLPYASGDFVTGVWVTDTFSIPGTDQIVKDQAFLNVHSGTEELTVRMSGLAGFSWPRHQTKKEWPFWYRLLPEWKDPMFAVWLGRNGVNKWTSQDGQVTLGGVNPSCMDGSLSDATFIDVQTTFDFANKFRFNKFRMPVEWAVRFQGFYVGDKRLDFDGKAVIDTGATSIFGPRSEVDKLYQTLYPSAVYDPQRKRYEIPCGEVKDLPSVFLRLGDEDIAIPLYDRHRTTSTNKCYGSIRAGGTDGRWAVGDVFLKEFYTIFRAEPKPQVGFATLKATNPCQ